MTLQTFLIQGFFFATDFPAVGSEKSLVSSLVNHVNDYELKMFLVKIIIRN